MGIYQLNRQVLRFVFSQDPDQPPLSQLIRDLIMHQADNPYPLHTRQTGGADLIAHQSRLAINRPSIADCAVYPYVVLAPEGDVNLEPYRHIARWIERLESLPGYQAKP